MTFIPDPEKMRRYPPGRRPYVQVTRGEREIHAIIIAWQGDMILICYPPTTIDKYAHGQRDVEWIHKSRAVRIRLEDSVWALLDDDWGWHGAQDAKISHRPDPWNSYVSRKEVKPAPRIWNSISDIKQPCGRFHGFPNLSYIGFVDLHAWGPEERMHHDEEGNRRNGLGRVSIGPLLAGFGPATAASPGVTKSSMEGEGLFANFDHTDGCIQTQVALLSNVSNVKGMTAPDKLAFVGISQVDKCTLTTLIDGFGQTAEFDQVVKNHLSNGTMKFSLDFNDSANAAVVPVTVGLSVKATAKATNTKVGTCSNPRGSS